MNADIIHRYYDPNTGRYLTPDPLLSDSDGINTVSVLVKHGTTRGSQFPVWMQQPERLFASYSYAFDNPLGFMDSTGKTPQMFGGSPADVQGPCSIVYADCIDAIDHRRKKCWPEEWHFEYCKQKFLECTDDPFNPRYYRRHPKGPEYQMKQDSYVAEE